MSYEAQAGCRKSDPKRYQGQLVTGQGTGLLCQDEGSSIRFRDTEEPSPLVLWFNDIKGLPRRTHVFYKSFQGFFISVDSHGSKGVRASCRIA